MIGVHLSSSVARLPRERMSDITAERFRFEKTSGIGPVPKLPKFDLKREELVEKFRAN